MREFHIAGEARRKYNLNDSLFSINGELIFKNNKAVRKLVAQLNKNRGDEKKIFASEVNALGLLHEIYHYVLNDYEKKLNPKVFEKAKKKISNQLDEKRLNKLFSAFNKEFPNNEINSGRVSVFEFLEGMTGSSSNTSITVEELFLLYLANFNPASKNLKELIDENLLKEKLDYKKLIDGLAEFFADEPGYGEDEQDIFSLLKAPILESPEDVEGQLDFIAENWKSILSDEILSKILNAKDLIKEDIRLGGGGSGPAVVPQYKGGFDGQFQLGRSGFDFGLDSLAGYEETEQFTDDVNWMPSVIILAKNSYVWLDQLSKKYGREIKLLDQVPDEELDLIARWNFNGLWLIGIWERSTASKRIKHLMGNIDAVSSAYSLYDYSIASDLGGEEAYANLNERAKKRGIRLASDMVPNHTGIFSKWMIEHPEFFIQSDEPPFPAYSFSGEDLCPDPNVSIRIEDGYFRKSDAAVVFQRIDNNSGEVKYIYHGNDGTNMPWNDTAQLDMLKSEVREAVIGEIFSVAKRFSIIRFDAAMTLAKKHFSRLWYPQPGHGGDIPSRADYSMTRRQFDEFFPKEFWREVVDRINTEMPETLLLAEAFWLMEGYFVRTLGMHRVYNSAFMHMMMNEENEKYRDLITNTLEFEPEILKRYVNFMSNPDEETAIHQFGSDDKYFAVTTLMVTLPGLPMFAHGQIEGLTEKYGMEYQRAYYNESPNQWLIERHERDIFPLMQKRYLFANVENFWLFDVIDEHGNLNENIYAFTNSTGYEKALVLVNNKYERGGGRINTSAPKLTDSGNGKELRTIGIADALGIRNEENVYYIFREHLSRMEFIRSGHEIHENGFHVVLNGFQHQVFWNFREIYDENGDLSQAAAELNGNGVPDVQYFIIQRKFQQVHDAFTSMFDESSLNALSRLLVYDDESDGGQSLKFVVNKFYVLLNESAAQLNLQRNLIIAQSAFKSSIIAVIKMGKMPGKIRADKKFSNRFVNNFGFLFSHDAQYHNNLLEFLIYISVKMLNETFVEGSSSGFEIVEKLMLNMPIHQILQRLGKGEYEINRYHALLRILFKYDSELFDIDMLQAKDRSETDRYKELIQKDKIQLIVKMIDDDLVKYFCGFNEFEGETYFSKENFEEMIEWMSTLKILRTTADDSNTDEDILNVLFFAEFLKSSAVDAGYQLTKLKSKMGLK